ncbi:MAG: NAD(P)-dependent oxidoreductase [Bacteroidota bacterium]|nr:NAD(P)-dependent oxidoreductase [Bacteroidota bacterium]
MKPRILVVSQVPREGLCELEKRFEVIYPETTVLNKDSILHRIPECDGVLSVFTRSFDREVISAGQNLKIIANFGVGYNNIDVDYATEHGIVVTNTPFAVCEPTAEMAMGLMLAVTRRIAECDRGLRTNPDFKWGLMENLGTGLWGKTLGIIGMGKIGKALARRAVTFGMKIQYHNRKPLISDEESKYNATYCSFEELLTSSDVISLNCPLTPETEHLIGESQLRMCKSSAFLINTARGTIVDEAALAKALEEGWIKGAGLDVYEQEPGINPGLLLLQNVVMTPHTGTGTIETRIETAREASENIIRFFEGRRDISIVNPSVFHRIH